MSKRSIAIRNSRELINAGKISVEEIQRAEEKLAEMLKNKTYQT